jgi:hypothetical protein
MKIRPRSRKILAATLVSVADSAILTLGQVNPNIDQGFHPYGSYEGGSVHALSLSNGG